MSGPIRNRDGSTDCRQPLRSGWKYGVALGGLGEDGFRSELTFAVVGYRSAAVGSLSKFAHAPPKTELVQLSFRILTDKGSHSLKHNSFQRRIVFAMERYCAGRFYFAPPRNACKFESEFQNREFYSARFQKIAGLLFQLARAVKMEF